MKFHNQPKPYEDFLDILNIIFTAVFAMEFVFKLAAFRFKVSFHNGLEVSDDDVLKSF